MLIAHCKAPSNEVLRPLRSARTSSFPVYRGLADRLLDITDHPDETVAHALATCSGYSYSDAPTLATVMARMGLDENNCPVILEPKNCSYPGATSAGGGVGSADWATIRRQM